MINRNFKPRDEVAVVNLDQHWGTLNWLIEGFPHARIGCTFIIDGSGEDYVNIIGNRYGIPNQNFLLKSDYDRLKNNYNYLHSTGKFFELHPELTGEWEKDIDRWIELAEKDESNIKQNINSPDPVEEMVKDVEINTTQLIADEGFLTSGYKTDQLMDEFSKVEEARANKSSDRVFESGSKRDNDDDKPLPLELNPYMLLRYGYHMRRGKQKYGDGNWQLGQPNNEIWRSMSRHFMAANMCEFYPELAREFGLDQEDHLSALTFGINMLMHNEAIKGVKPDHYFKKQES